MTVYPFAIDDDSTIQRIDDNLSELGTQVINQLRSAVFSIEKQLGLSPAGSLSSVANRLDVSINSNGTIKSSALTSVGLVALPITDAQVGSNAGIKESKIALDYSTANLQAQITNNTNILNSLSAFTATTQSDLLAHISGASILSDGTTPGRHVASQIDLNAIPFDTRDPFFIWNGLRDRNGNLRPATTVVEALLEINDDYTSHQNDQDGYAHYASGISLDTSSFQSLPKSANTVQKGFDAIDQIDTNIIKSHQANLHSNGIPREARSEVLSGPDGYSQNIIPPTAANAYLVKPSATSPVDNNITGDDIISFAPVNTGFLFDAQFAQVNVGDIVRVNYGNGIESIFEVESKRHLPGVEWVVRINGINLFNAEDDSAIVRIDRPLFETNKFGTLAVAAANNDIYSNIMGSLIIGNPNAARALGIAFDPTQLDSLHYNLYIEFYPTGNPNDFVISLPAIDVTGNQGTTPGQYTLDSVVQTVNDAFRSGGYNYRFIAYNYGGEFGIMLSDTINNASFSITNGIVSGTVLASGSYVNNVVGDVSDNKDALGFGALKSALASPAFVTSYSSAQAAQSFPTKVLPSLKYRSYVVNGLTRDTFAPTYMANKDGYWDGYISNRLAVGATTVETTYTILLDLSAAKLKPGKTLIIQPAISLSDSLYNSVDYGRFIIKNVFFAPDCPCPGDTPSTTITVVNSRHATGNPVGFTSIPQLPVRIYFSEDSVSFNQSNVVDAVDTGEDYIRYHEVFINQDGYSFTHERARMVSQTETVTLLDTSTSWIINEVSPKFIGYTTSTSNISKFVRFYVLNYDSVSGEFDGYLGKPNLSTGITDFGRIVTARKNVPTKFYDSTDVDFIELTFNEIQQYPGKSILTTNSARYVDIEIFPTLALDQEFIRLSACNLIGNYVSFTNDLRQFGNVSEMDFSSSAIRFIESGDRLLHANGIFAGFTYQGELTNGTLTFTGGQALINGHITSVSAQKINIPEIVQDTGGGQVTTLDWAICVNDQGLLQALPLTQTKQQFFARRLADSDNYYIQSVTFSEIANARKDLVIIAVANVTIASITVNNVRDARKFIESETANIPLTLYGNDSASGKNIVVGNFNTFEQLIEWVNGFGATGDNYVKLKGTFEIGDEINLTGLTSPLTLDGIDGNNVIVTSRTGFRIRSNIKLKNINFKYNTVFSGLTSGSLAHLDQDAGCIVVDAVSNVSTNTEISNCDFAREVSGERAPYVQARINNSLTYQISKIVDNTFSVGNDDTYNCAIGITHTAAGAGITPAVASDININNNIINGAGSIILTTQATNSIGLATFNVNITENDLYGGPIGFHLSSTEVVSNVISEARGAKNGLNIVRNNCRIIANLSATGKNDGLFTGGFVSVEGNKLSRFYCQSGGNGTGNDGYHSNIDVFNNTFITDQWSSASSIYNLIGTDYALYNIQGFNTQINIKNNLFIKSDTYTYGGCILLLGSGDISGNTFRGFSTSCINVIVLGNVSITNNSLYRGQTTVLSYITLSGAGSVPNRLMVTENIFDHPTIDGSTTNVINDGSTITSKIIDRNINQTVVRKLAPGIHGGGFSPAVQVGGGGGISTFNYIKAPGSSTYPNIISSTANIRETAPNYRSYGIVTFSITDEAIARWNVPLTGFIPDGAKIIGISLNASCSQPANWTTCSVNIQLFQLDTPLIATTTQSLLPGGSATLTLTPTITSSTLDNLFVICSVIGDSSTGGTFVTVETMNVTYRY